MTISSDEYYGRGQTFAVTGSDVSIERELGRVVRLDVQQAGRAVILPDPQKLPYRPGGPVFYLCNTGTQSIAVKDQGGNNIHTIPIDTSCIAMLLQNADANGVWAFLCRAITGDQPVGPTTATTASSTTAATTPPPQTTTTQAATTTVAPPTTTTTVAPITTTLPPGTTTTSTTTGFTEGPV